MNPGNEQEIRKRKKRLAVYNMIANLAWTIPCLAPVAFYSYFYMQHSILYSFLAISMAPAFLKNSFLRKLQVSKSAAVYKKLGVHHANKVAQNGVIINSLLTKEFPAHKIVSVTKRSIAVLVNQSYVFEKFHWVLLLFFALITIHATIHGSWTWVLVIQLLNIAYNIYPILLQQYIRTRIYSLSVYFN